MKLVRYGESKKEKPGVLDSAGRIRDLSAKMTDLAGDFLRDIQIQKHDVDSLPIVGGEQRLGPCVGGVGKFICIGLNYADHAAEIGARVPAEPVVFMKATSAITGPNDGIIKPLGSTKLDWEVELGIVIGKEARYIDEEYAMDYIAGYCVVHDVSERYFQLECGGQWDKGKGCDSFGPIGPWLVTRDEIPYPNTLDIWLKVNGVTFQQSNTENMIFGPAKLVSYLSRFMSLQPGDIISTGTPPGVGLGQKPPKFLAVGDEVELGVDGLGVQKQTVRASTAR